MVIKTGGQSFPEYSKPSWLSMPDPTVPTFTINDYFAQVAVSLLVEGNYFVHVYPDVYDPQVLTVLDPGRVTIKAGPTYEIKDAFGVTVNTFRPNQILHGVWMPWPGQMRGISPLETLGADRFGHRRR